MKYPVVIHKDKDSDFGVTVPDLPGCFSAGETIEAALTNATEAIECHVEGLLMDGLSVPAGRSIEFHRDDRSWEDGIWALVDVDIIRLSGKPRRVNITLPENLLSQIDSYTIKHGNSRSGFLAQAALEYFGRQNQESG